MREFYPGSKIERKIYSPDKEPEAETPYDLGAGREFLIGTKVTRLYSIGVMARALNRASGTLRLWEESGVIPKPTLILPSGTPNGKRRLYTEEQIMGLRRIAREEGILSPNENNKWAAVEKTRFRERALELWRELSERNTNS